MPKHRNQKKSKPQKSTKQPKSEKSRRPQLGASAQNPPDLDPDEERAKLDAALAAYLSDLDEDEREAAMAHIRALRETLGDEFEIMELGETQGELDDDDDIDDYLVDTGEWNVPATVSAADLLTRLVSAPELPTPYELYGFSDLTREDAELVRQQWELISPDRRHYVIDELVTLAEEDIDLHLARLLRIVIQDPDPTTRRAAVRGLWNDNETDLIGPLIQMLHADPDESVRAAAATGLGGYILLGELEELDAALAMRVEEALLGVINQASEPLEVRRRALESIAFSGEAGVRQLIEDAYYSPDELMRISAIFAMGRSADVRWRNLVRAELQNPSAAVRAEAARACGELGAKSAAEDLSVLLQDRDENVRLAAILALGHVGGSFAREALETVLLSDNPTEVETAEFALEELAFYDQTNAVSLFDESLDDADEEDAEAEDDEWSDEFMARDLGEYGDSDDADDDETDDEPDDDDLDDDDDDDDDESGDDWDDNAAGSALQR